MAKQKRRDDEELSALYVRLPRAQAEKLDRIAFSTRMPKRDIIETLVAEHLPEDGPVFFRQFGPDAVVGHAEVLPAQGTDVLTAAQAAELLQTDEAAVVALAESGDLPGRRIGDDWRFLRSAVLGWLAG
jgi:excisionase family DNA binding protein